MLVFSAEHFCNDKYNALGQCHQDFNASMKSRNVLYTILAWRTRFFDIAAVGFIVIE